MQIDEEKKQERLLLLLLALARETEKKVNTPVRRRLTEVMRRLRRLIQRMSPTGMLRQVEWTRLSPQVVPLLEEIVQSMRVYLLPSLQQLLPDVQDAAFDYQQNFVEEVSMAELRPKTQAELMTTIHTGTGITLLTMIGKARAGSRLARSMAKDLDRMVRSQILAEATTQEISDKVIKLMQSKGELKAVLNTGSYANQMWNRLTATTAGAVWHLVNTGLNETWQDLPVKGWYWNSRLDPITCPVCRPLHLQKRATPSAFPAQPPIHPNCRCSIIPELG
jgi:hypothetical protein